MKIFTKEELVTQGIKDRVNYESALTHLKMDWNLEDNFLIAVSVLVGGSHDLATTFLEWLDGAGYWAGEFTSLYWAFNEYVQLENLEIGLFNTEALN